MGLRGCTWVHGGVRASTSLALRQKRVKFFTASIRPAAGSGELKEAGGRGSARRRAQRRRRAYEKGSAAAAAAAARTVGLVEPDPDVGDDDVGRLGGCLDTVKGGKGEDIRESHALLPRPAATRPHASVPPRAPGAVIYAVFFQQEGLWRTAGGRAGAAPSERRGWLAQLGGQISGCQAAPSRATGSAPAGWSARPPSTPAPRTAHTRRTPPGEGEEGQ